jgi:hypothetical protein
VTKRTLAALALGAAALPLPGGTAQASGGGGGGEGLHLVPMDEIVVPIVDADRVQGSLRFKIVLDAGNDAVAQKVTAELPMLRSAALGAALEFARLEASALRAVDAEQLDHDLTTALKGAEHDLSRVLIVEVAASRS